MTRDVSAEYEQWAHGGESAAFAPDSPYGGDALAVRSGRIDAGRLELHQHVERVLAASGSDDYDEALAVVLSQARSGALALSQQALEGTGIVATRPGRDGLRHDALTGEVVALAGAPTAAPLGQPPAAPEDGALFADTLAFCEARKPGATDADRNRAIETAVARGGTAGRAEVTRWLAQGGAEAAGLR